MSIHSQDSDNEELGAIGGNKPISRQVSPFSRPSSVAIIESLFKQQQEQMQQQQRENIQQQREQMQQQKRKLMQSITDQSDTTTSTLADISRTD